VQNAKATAISQAGSVVTQVNDLVDQIAALNGQIRASKAIGDNPNTYEDQRDEDIDKLAQLVSVQTSVQPNGSTLVTIGGRALVNDTQAYHLAQPVIATNASGNPQLVVGFVGDPSPSNPVPASLGSGQLAGYVDLYNNNLTQYGQQLDAFASATASAINHITESGYDANGNAGVALFAPVVSAQAITATNIGLGISSASQVSSALASTAAGSLTVSFNAANNTVDTSAAIVGNTTLAHPGAALGGSTSGTLTVTVNGVNQTFAYDIAAGPPAGNADTIGDLITNFNKAQLGVTASYDTVAQKIVFTRDPNNESASLQAQATTTSPTFAISDSNAIQGGSQGTPSNSILEILGAANLENAGPPPAGIVQNATNAFGGADNSAANAVLKVFSTAQPVPGGTASASNAGALGPGSVTLTPPAGSRSAFAQFVVGQQVTVDAAYGTAENVTITAVDRTTGTITVTLASPHNPTAAKPLSVTATPSQTLGAYYGSLVTQMGYDTQSTTTATTTQTSLASNIDQARQSIDGINLDEETQHLIQYQNAYTAAAKTVSVVAQLLQTAVGLIP
jgi:flagellar hook-associated protein FlgK